MVPYVIACHRTRELIAQFKLILANNKCKRLVKRVKTMPLALATQTDSIAIVLKVSLASTVTYQ